MTTLTVTRETHAAHYAYVGGGHDLEWFTFPSPRNVRHPELPSDAEYHSGFLKDGVQHWSYIRKLPLSPGKCPRCNKS
jgi:hypothetical protein